jgi:hypothetical protein
VSADRLALSHYRAQYLKCLSAKVIVQVDSEETAKMISSQIPIFEALIKGCKEVKIVTKDGDVPAGCGTEQISVQAIVHVPVKVCLAPDELHCGRARC